MSGFKRGDIMFGEKTRGHLINKSPESPKDLFLFISFVVAFSFCWHLSYTFLFTFSYFALVFLQVSFEFFKEEKADSSLLVKSDKRGTSLRKRKKMRMKPTAVTFVNRDSVDNDDSDLDLDIIEEDCVRVVEEGKLDLFMENEMDTSSTATSFGSAKSIDFGKKQVWRTRSVPNLSLETPLTRVLKDLRLLKELLALKKQNNPKARQIVEDTLRTLSQPESLTLPQRIHKCLSGNDATWCNYLQDSFTPYLQQKAEKKRKHKSKLFSSKSFRFPKKQQSIDISHELMGDEVDLTLEMNSDLLRKQRPKLVKSGNNSTLSLEVTQGRSSRSHSVDWVLEDLVKSRERSSSDSADVATRFSYLPSLVVGKKLNNWNLDVFSLGNETSQRPLTWLLMYIFKERSWGKKFKIAEQRYLNFCRGIEKGYDPNIPYHNNLHAADVVNSTYHFLLNMGFASGMPEIVVFAGIVAAAAHDFKHPGRTARFLIHNRDPLALRYNDRSVLEQMHLAETFSLLSRKENDLTENMTEKEYLRFRELVIHSVLSTDLKHHLDTIRKVKQQETNIFDPTLCSVEEQQTLTLEVSLKLADVGHAGKESRLHRAWSRRIQEEFYLQGDAERDLGLAVSPHMDRTTPDLAQNQLSFFKFIALPLFESVALAKNTPDEFQTVFDSVLRNEKMWQELIVKRS